MKAELKTVKRRFQDHHVAIVHLTWLGVIQSSPDLCKYCFQIARSAHSILVPLRSDILVSVLKKRPFAWTSGSAVTLTLFVDKEEFTTKG